MEQISTVSNGIVNTLIIAAIIGIAAPITAALVFGIKNKISAVPFLTGVVAYLFVEVLLRTVLLNAVLSNAVTAAFFKSHAVLYQFLLAFSIVILEEPMRLGLFKSTLRRFCDDNGAIAFGIGFGGTACLITCGIASLSSFLTASAANAGYYDAMTAVEIADLAAASTTISQYKITELVVGIVKALSEIVMQAAFTFIIMRGIRFKTVVPCLVIALVGHFIFSAAPGLLELSPAGYFIGGLICSVAATCMIYYMVEAIRRYNYYEKNKELE